MTTRRMQHPAPARPELDALLAKAKGYRMSPEEREAQRRSWVTGELMLSNPRMTKEEADRLYDEAAAAMESLR